MRLFKKNFDPRDIESWPAERRAFVEQVLRDYQQTPDALGWKGTVADEMDLSSAEATAVAVVNSDGVDNVREVVDPRGVDLTMFRKNPVVPFGHDYGSLPVGKSVWQRVERDGERANLLAKTRFQTSRDFARDVWQSVKEGFLKGWSVGFVTLDSGAPTDKEIKRFPHWEGADRIIRRWVMLEYSVAPVPCNPEALSLAVSKGMHIPDGLAEEWADILAARKAVDAAPEGKPYANEHAARLVDPDEFEEDSFRRVNDKFGDGVHAIFGRLKGEDTATLQAIRFAADKFTVTEAKAWLKEHDYTPILFEEAEEARSYFSRLPAWRRDTAGHLALLSSDAVADARAEAGDVDGRPVVWIHGRAGAAWRLSAVEFPAASWQEGEARRAAADFGARMVFPAAEKKTFLGLTPTQTRDIIRSLTVAR